MKHSINRVCRRCFTSTRLPINPTRQKFSSKLGTTNDDPSDISSAQNGVAGLKRRPAKYIPDHLTPTHSHLLNTMLTDLINPGIPSSCSSHSQHLSSPPSDESYTKIVERFQRPPIPLPQGHHLVYFPLQTPPSILAAGDGADPDHSPGEPYAKRLWAGGEIVFHKHVEKELLLDGRNAICKEEIGDVRVKDAAKKGDEKVFVDLWRQYGGTQPGIKAAAPAQDGDPEAGDSSWQIEERRTLVFMRKEDGDSSLNTASAPRVIKYPHQPDHSITILPTATHLFHFSALTFNAHAIHIDPLYAQSTDGHRGLLVHGPLTLALMLRVLRDYTGESVDRIVYRNHAPLYVDEPLTLCMRHLPRKQNETHGDGAEGSVSVQKNQQTWDVWVQGPEGGLAVKGTAATSV